MISTRDFRVVIESVDVININFNNNLCLLFFINWLILSFPFQNNPIAIIINDINHVRDVLSINAKYDKAFQ